MEKVRPAWAGGAAEPDVAPASAPPRINRNRNQRRARVKRREGKGCMELSPRRPGESLLSFRRESDASGSDKFVPRRDSYVKHLVQKYSGKRANVHGSAVDRRARLHLALPVHFHLRSSR